MNGAHDDVGDSSTTYKEYSKDKPKNEHSWPNIIKVLFKKGNAKRIIKWKEITIRDVRRFGETREFKQILVVNQNEFLIAAATSVVPGIKFLPFQSPSTQIELTVRTLKAMKKLFGYGAKEETKISSLRGSVGIWHVANLDIFISNLCSLLERTTTEVGPVWRAYFSCVHTMYKQIFKYILCTNAVCTNIRMQGVKLLSHYSILISRIY